jgi:hypothetical protein
VSFQASKEEMITVYWRKTPILEMGYPHTEPLFKLIRVTPVEEMKEKCDTTNPTMCWCLPTFLPFLKAELLQKP